MSSHRQEKKQGRALGERGTYADGALALQALGPEPVQDQGRAREAPVVRQQQPGAEDGLGQEVEHGVGDDLAVDACDAGAIGHGPDTTIGRNKLVSTCVKRSAIMGASHLQNKRGRGDCY